MTIAKILNAHPAEIIFTSGATESNNLAILGLIYPYLASPYSRGRKKEGVLPHIITTNIEHPSVLETFKLLEKRKLAQISIVPVEANGIVDPKKIKKVIRKNTILVSVMYANNEIGTVQPIKERKVNRSTKPRVYFFRVWDPRRSGVQPPTKIIFNGDLKNRLPNNINITIPGIPSDLLVIELSTRGIMVAGKSACKSGDGKASHVIKAINKNSTDTDGSLRFSLGRSTTKKDIDYTVKSLSEILQKLKRWYN